MDFRAPSIALFLFSAACGGSREAAEVADLVLRNGNFVTMNEALPHAQALAIAADHILAVGTNEAIEPFISAATRVVDLGGKTAVPGLIDSHMHFSRLGKRTKTLFLDSTQSPAEALALVEERVRQAPPGQWITGEGWHTVYWRTEDYPDNRKLSEMAPENPVYLVGMASHAAWVNDKALELAGIDAETADPTGGRILKDPATGKPTGILLENATDLVAAVLPEETHVSRKADIELSVATALTLGLTSVQDAGVGDEEIAIYKELLQEDRLRLRLYVMVYVPDGGELFERTIAHPPEIDLGDHRLTIRAVKAYADGALGARGAALLEPYSDSPKDSGLIPNSSEEIDAMVSKAMKAGYQICIHAIGDRGNRVVLDAVEKAEKELGIATSRPRIEHAQILSPEDIPRFAELGVIASMQPVHATMDMGFAETRVGPERIKGAYAWKSLLDSGAKVVASADTPSFPVTYTNPLWGIYAAVTRQDNQGSPPGGWYPDQRVDRDAALAMYTIDAAYASFEEDVKGSLTPGKLADVTILDKDILTIPAPEILKTEVVMTIVGGVIAYEK